MIIATWILTSIILVFGFLWGYYKVNEFVDPEKKFKAAAKRNIKEIKLLLPETFPKTWEKNNPGYTSLLMKSEGEITSYCISCILLVEGLKNEDPSPSINRLGHLVWQPLKYLKEDNLNVPKGYTELIKHWWDTTE